MKYDKRRYQHPNRIENMFGRALLHKSCEGFTS